MLQRYLRKTQMTEKVIVIDCPPGYHHPPTSPGICVPDTPVTCTFVPKPAAPVPSLDVGLGVVLFIVLIAFIARGVWRARNG